VFPKLGRSKSIQATTYEEFVDAFNNTFRPIGGIERFNATLLCKGEKVTLNQLKEIFNG